MATSRGRWLWCGFVASLAGCLNPAIAANTSPREVRPAAVTLDTARGGLSPAVRWLPTTMRWPDPLAIDSRGRLVAVKTSCECIVYDLEAGAERHRWNDGRRVVEFTPDGRFLLAVHPRHVSVWSTDGFVEQVRITRNKPEWNAEVHRRGTWSDAPRAAINDDATLIAVSNHHRLFDRNQPAGVLIHGRDGRFLHRLPVPEEAWLHEITFLRGNLLLVSFGHRKGKEYGTFDELWDAASGRRIQAFPENEKALGSRHSRWIATWQRPVAGRTGIRVVSLSIYDATSGNLHRVLRDLRNLGDFKWSPDGTRALATVDGHVVEWDVASGDVVFESGAHPGGWPYVHVAYCPDGKRRFATWGEPNGVDDDTDDKLAGWDVATGAKLPIAEYLLGYSSYEKLFFWPKGDRFLDLSHPFRVQDVLTGEIVQTVPNYHGSCGEASFLDDSRFLLGPESMWGTALLTDAVTGNQREWRLPGRNHTAVRGGSAVMSWDHDGPRLTDAATGVTLWRMGPRLDPWRAEMATDASGRWLVTTWNASSRGKMAPRLIVIDTKNPDEPLVLHRFASAVALAPDGRQFVAASHDSIDLCDIETGDRIRSLARPPGRVQFVTMSADGVWVLAGGVRGHHDMEEPVAADDEGWAMVVSTATGQTTVLDGHTGPVTRGAFSSDGLRCATGSMDTTIRLWTTSSGKLAHCFRGHRGPIHKIAYAPHGDRILSAAEDGAAIWNVAGVVDRAARPGPIAETFQVVEKVDALAGPPIVQSKVMPAKPDAGTDSLPVLGGADWPVICVGDANPTSWKSNDWVTRADALLFAPAARRPVVPGPFAHWDLLGISQDGCRRLLESRSEKQIVVVDDRDHVLARVKRLSRFGEPVALASSGKEFAIARELVRPRKNWEKGEYEVTIHDTGTGQIQDTIDGIEAWALNGLSIDPSGRTLLLRLNNGRRLEVRSLGTGETVGRLEVASGVDAACYTPDGRFILTYEHHDPAVHLRDPRTLELVRSLEHDLPVSWHRFAPGDRHLIVGQHYAHATELITAWDMERGTRVWSRCGPGGSRGAIFSPNGRLCLLESNSDPFWALWDVEHGAPCCVVVTQRKKPPVFGPGGDTLHQETPDGPQLWPLVKE